MKKIVFYFSLILLAVLILPSCDDKDDDGLDDVKKNTFEYDGKTHSINDAVQLFYGHYYSNEANNIMLIFATNDHYIGFEMFVPNKDTKLVSGTYEPDGTYRSFTISEGFISDDENTLLHLMISGVITIKLEDGIYIIDMEGKLDDNTNIKGNFTGAIGWSDKSEDPDNSNYNGSMTITGGGSDQTIYIEPAQQIRAGNFIMLYFSGSFIVNFNIGSSISSTLPAGTYSISTINPLPAGTSGVSMNIPGMSGVINAKNGSFTVKKSGSEYQITFSFTTDTTPARTVTGSYTGQIPLS